MEPMEFDFWQTVAESAVGWLVPALLVVVVALGRLIIKSRKEYNLFNAISQAAEATPGQKVLWFGPALRFEQGSDTTWAYEPIVQEQMKWRTWLRKGLGYSLLYKRSTAEPKGLRAYGGTHIPRRKGG